MRVSKSTSITTGGSIVPLDDLIEQLTEARAAIGHGASVHFTCEHGNGDPREPMYNYRLNVSA